MSRLDQLAAITSVEGEISRFYLTREHAAAVKLISGWMTEAGLDVAVDPAGTLIGRKEGATRAAKTLLLGSHIDTVANAGRFDGCLGVVVAIEAMAELRRLGRSLPYSVEVVAFGGAEASRFPTMLVGARVLTGGAPPGVLDVADSDGVTLRQALTEFGCDPDKISDAARRASDLLGYVEVHIEHGLVLQGEGVSVGVVMTIDQLATVSPLYATHAAWARFVLPLTLATICVILIAFVFHYPGKSLAPIPFVAGTLLVLVPLVVAIPALFLGLVCAAKLRALSLFFVLVAPTLVVLGFLLDRHPWPAIAGAVLTATPIALAFARRRQLVIPVRRLRSS